MGTGQSAPGQVDVSVHHPRGFRVRIGSVAVYAVHDHSAGEIYMRALLSITLALLLSPLADAG